MNIQDYIEALERIQNHLITMPENEALTESFSNEQEKLAKLIEMLPLFSLEEQLLAKESMRTFSEKLTQKLSELKTRMRYLSQDMEQQQNRVKGIRAYGKKSQIGSTIF